MNKHYLAFIMIVAAGLLSACGDDDGVERLTSLGDDNTSEADFKSYLKIKNIPDTPGVGRDQTKKIFDERIKLANAIAKEGKLDKATLEAKMRHYRNELIISSYFADFQKASVADDTVKKYYEDNKKKFSSRKAKAAQILVRVPPHFTEEQRKKKFQHMVSIHGKLKAGESFSSLAKKYSDDRAAGKKGGAMGMVEEQRVDPIFATTLFSLKKGRYSEPFNTLQGFHIVKLLSNPVTEAKPFESLKGQIAYQMKSEAKEKELKRLLGSGS